VRNITRYRAVIRHIGTDVWCKMVADEDGEYVTYSDHCETVCKNEEAVRAEQKRLREAMDYLINKYPNK
jgi:hypothetical protein